MTNATSFKNSSAYVGLLLGTITFFCLVFVFITRQATSEAINEVNSSAQNKAFKELLEGITYNNNPLKSCYLIDGLGKKDHKIYVAKFNDTPLPTSPTTMLPVATAHLFPWLHPLTAEPEQSTTLM